MLNLDQGKLSAARFIIVTFDNPITVRPETSGIFLNQIFLVKTERLEPRAAAAVSTSSAFLRRGY